MTAIDQLPDYLAKQKTYFSTGETKSVAFRIRQLRLLRELLQDHESDLIEAVHKDFKKPAFETYATELGLIFNDISYAIKNLDQWAKPKSVPSPIVNFPSKNFIITEPYGCALIIAPWNYPLLLSLQPLVGALAAGNTIILKPSELTPHTSELLASLFSKYFQEEYIRVVLGAAETSKALVELDFDYIFFTGSNRVGKSIMRTAAERITPLTLELGGKSPCIVDETANLEISAKRIAWGKFINAGQTCVAPDYLLIQPSIKKEFLSYLKDSIEQLYGANPVESEDYPRIINQAHFERLSNLLDAGTTVAGGQTNAETLYIAPTVIDDVTKDDPVMQEEIFGPILPVLEFNTLEECVEIIHRHPRPLALYLFSNTQSFEDAILERISFGGGAINDTITQMGNHHLSFGGVGASGFGSYHGKASFDTFSHQKSVMKKPFWPDVPLRYAPYDGKLGIVKKILK